MPIPAIKGQATWISPSWLARVLGVTKRGVEKHIRNGTIPHRLRNRDGVILFKASEVKNWLKHKGVDWRDDIFTRLASIMGDIGYDDSIRGGTYPDNPNAGLQPIVPKRNRQVLYGKFRLAFYRRLMAKLHEELRLSDRQAAILTILNGLQSWHPTDLELAELLAIDDVEVVASDVDKLIRRGLVKVAGDRRCARTGQFTVRILKASLKAKSRRSTHSPRSRRWRSVR